MSNSTNGVTISVAPMMDWTDRHCRYFMRRLSPHARLYTEMVTATALQHGDAARLLRFDPSEHPVALQVGGSDPRLLMNAAKMGEDAGFDEINFNVGCPSDRVQSGQFGACLMSAPERVARCVETMRSVCEIPITIKTRIGIDNDDNYEFLRNFIAVNVAAGCTTYIVHARKAILGGLSPKENRSVPPLDYPRVYRLKKEFPALRIILNGGIVSVADCRQHLRHVDGVMIGRQAYHQPWFLTELEREFGGSGATGSLTREDVIRQLLPYIERQLAEGAELKHITRHLLGLFAGQAGARAWRRYLSEHAHVSGAGLEVLETALALLPQAVRKFDRITG